MGRFSCFTLKLYEIENLRLRLQDVVADPEHKRHEPEGSQPRREILTSRRLGVCRRNPDWTTSGRCEWGDASRRVAMRTNLELLQNARGPTIDGSSKPPGTNVRKVGHSGSNQSLLSHEGGDQSIGRWCWPTPRLYRHIHFPKCTLFGAVGGWEAYGMS